MTNIQAMQYNKFQKQNLKIDIAYLQILLLTNALSCFYMIVNPWRMRASFLQPRSVSPYNLLLTFRFNFATKIQQDFDSRQWSEDLHLFRNIVLIPRRIPVAFRVFNPMILALNVERKFHRQIQRRQSWTTTIQLLNFRSQLFYRSRRQFIWASHSQVKQIKANDTRTNRCLFPSASWKIQLTKSNMHV